ncbi:hypothetical protein [Merismopedia glauca]|uniref:Uncharacterized protein n=1 Tax=Merismopedia glauca CCAP 1448/3 TaxID=1296344 RepID=A0A2T1BXU0_9CYAN|nr:hypothetical protein [Merismopedia glauca]PSB00835.1 hypothetical protein C7B64_21420 [Merismopedia glauca CCAP 1448/3]
MPIVWVKWVSEVLEIQRLLPEQPDSLKLLGDNWNENWKVGESFKEGRVIGYAWCEKTNSAQAIVESAGIVSCIDLKYLEQPSSNTLTYLDNFASSSSEGCTISPSKKRRRKGLGTGYLFCKPIVRNHKEYPQWWYQWEEKKGGKWMKRTAFVSKKVLSDVQLLESEKSPVILILKTIGVY